ncbi:PREDICTED: neuferricin [Buceros rhinoceros silvestris]|uniref:neuferricin n=1 Tax=Buceros rhinoceros silvestris TaxID=175836 RepID=UPI000528DD75|nr:PREDICTED: neuferricin [Buceros rhinoceros silvestris]
MLAMLAVPSWLSFYGDNYEPVGKLVGRFYDENGAPTEALRQAEAAIEEALKFQAESEQRKQQFPLCNSEWSSKGSRFWCSRQSGGVSRDWTGVPRKLYQPGSRGSRCVCVRTTGPPWGQPDSAEHDDRGDLDNPHLEEYSGCHPLGQQCVLAPDEFAAVPDSAGYRKEDSPINIGSTKKKKPNTALASTIVTG